MAGLRLAPITQPNLRQNDTVLVRNKLMWNKLTFVNKQRLMILINCSSPSSHSQPQQAAAANQQQLSAITPTPSTASHPPSVRYSDEVDINKVLERQCDVKVDNGCGGGGSGGGNDRSGGGGGGGGGGGSGGGGEEEAEEEEFGPILKFDEVMKEVEKQGVELPSDMLEAAKSVGLRRLILFRYLESQAAGGLVGFAMRSWAMLRNRMLADPAFLFKIGTEIVIDSCCATFAEVQKRGKDFWAEFELYVADLLVGVVVNVALVGMLAPYVRIGQPSLSKGFLGRWQQAYNALPSSVFEAERPGCRFTVQQRMATYFYKGIMYASVGFACGIIGQGIANLIMTAKRSIKKSEEDIPVPPLVKSAALWGVFLGVSSNTRYQIVNGLERLVEASPLAKQVPPVAMAFTVGVRFANNIYGGMQFVDWARMTGVQ